MTVPTFAEGEGHFGRTNSGELIGPYDTADELAAALDEANAELECIDGPDGCEGEVKSRTTPDRDDSKTFLRCEKHFEQRLENAERNLEYLSDTEPDWFDPMYAGERWADDY